MPAFGAFAGALPLRLTPELRTGWSAAAHARFCADLVAAKRTAPLAVLTFTVAATVATLHACWSMVEIGSATDSAPTLTSSGTGIVLVTFDHQFADEFDIGGYLAIRHGKLTGHGATAIKHSLEVVSPNSVRVRLFDSAGAAVDGKATLKVS
jgi:hypothetical protein